MCQRFLKATALAVLSLTLASCSGAGEGLYPVYGKVTCKGEPASGAYVVLVREGPAEPGATEGEPPSAMVEEDGRFTVTSADRGYGAPPGKYKVIITWRTGLATDAAKDREAAAKKKRRGGATFKPDKHEMLAPDRFKGRYADPAKSPLTAEVKAETNNLPPFDLTD
jgi:hypothetical protein